MRKVTLVMSSSGGEMSPAHSVANSHHCGMTTRLTCGLTAGLVALDFQFSRCPSILLEFPDTMVSTRVPVMGNQRGDSGERNQRDFERFHVRSLRPF